MKRKKEQISIRVSEELGARIDALVKGYHGLTKSILCRVILKVGVDELESLYAHIAPEKRDSIVASYLLDDMMDR